MITPEHPRNVVLLPGLPHGGLANSPGNEIAQRLQFDVVASRWRGDGYNVAVHPFGWYRERSFGNSMERLGNTIRSLGDKACLVGFSAGGPEALCAMQQFPDMVEGVATVASPHRAPSSFMGQARIPGHLRQANKVADSFLLSLPTNDPRRRLIKTFYGNERRVRKEWSQLPHIDGHNIGGLTHGHVILRGALTERRVVQKALERFWALGQNSQ